MRTLRILPLLLLAAAYSTASITAAQSFPGATLTGRIVDLDQGGPLIGAHVFIAESMMGTTTDDDGRYRLDNVPLGAHRLYVSMLGFEPGIRDVLLREASVQVYDFSLEPAVLEAGEIIVEAERDDRWKERLERFTRNFIGESPNAAEVTIVNPEVLDFTSGGGALRAFASEPLVIENRALGYTIRYFLKDFEAEPSRTKYDGEPLYEELEPASPAEAARWETNRTKAFMGSFRHFLLATIAGRTEGQGFRTYSRPGMGNTLGGTFSSGGGLSERRFPLDPNNLLEPGEAPNEYVLELDGYVEIIYMGEEEDPAYYEWSRGQARRGARAQTSWITMERGPTIVDYKGDILDPYGVTFSGYLAFERVADEVPKEYRPR